MEFIRKRKSLQVERLIYEIVGFENVTAEEHDWIKQNICGDLVIPYEDLRYVAVRSNLEGWHQDCYCICQNERWYILTWHTM